MSCEQKSGVFLNKSCSRTVTNTCSNCDKKTCHVHFHRFDESDLCEDCYWEKYLYAEEKKNNYNPEIYDDSDGTIISSSSSSNDSEDAGFDGGFGGGGFGGGGAAGTWTDGDAKGFEETDSTGGLLNSDETFYYS
ncbi:hypothetical protein [Maribacter sp. 2308TA10-17]|uniref:hypothetical protein n=1 Tax=Maribacter sp. 2308TA10-17 TaxID=3386276 RepID=UPI0039BD50FC